MFASKVIISEETKEKNKLDKTQIGRLRYERLVELENTGKLSQATTRTELAAMLGFGERTRSIVSWISYQIERGYLSESITGYRDGLVRKEFHTTNKKPDYDYKRFKKAKPEQKVETPVAQQCVEEKQSSTDPTITKEDTANITITKKDTANLTITNEATTNLTITKGNITISATVSAQDTINMITDILTR